MTMPSPSRSANVAVEIQRKGALILISALLLAMLGPFGTALTMSPVPRAAYWLATVSLIGGAIFAVRSFADRKLFGGCAPAWFVLAVAALGALPGAFVVRACLAHWSPQALAHLGLSQLGLEVLIVNLMAATIELGLRRHQRAQPQASAGEKPTQGISSFMARLPGRLRASRLLAIEAQDHYIQVHTDAGSALLHMRISDAAALLSASEGLRAHRSFWVARSAVERIERRDGRQFLHLSNGLCVPVGRAHKATLQQAGWL